jgi:hypothetical protein
MNNLLKSNEERQPSKKKTNSSRGSIFILFYSIKDTFKKKDVS